MCTLTNPVHHRLTLLFASAAATMLIAGASWADPFFFSTGSPNGLMAAASRPDSAGKIEIEAADDFVLTGSVTSLTSATFTGLLTGATTANIGEIRVEIYRVFPKDSTNPPSGNVLTRVNSPSDVEYRPRHHQR